jgi:hypothetical protein
MRRTTNSAAPRLSNCKTVVESWRAEAVHCALRRSEEAQHADNVFVTSAGNGEYPISNPGWQATVVSLSVILKPPQRRHSL